MGLKYAELNTNFKIFANICANYEFWCVFYCDVVHAWSLFRFFAISFIL
jgi:hypothetical protein